jgi:succinyl-CoA synthetase beta subunit
MPGGFYQEMQMKQKEEAEKILQAAVAQGRLALSEYEAKQVLAAYGVPVTREVLAKTPDEAVAAAGELGYPVVLKACSPSLMHKSDTGLVELGLADEAAVRSAFDRISFRLTAEADGMLVSEMVSGKRELVVGMNRDPQFGPCVMLGLGGVMTEIFKDAVFRMAPVDPIEVAEMAGSLKAAKLLDAFRGEAPADRDALYRCVIGAGRIGLDWDAVSEIDINPVLVSADGRVKAVDALIVLNPDV